MATRVVFDARTGADERARTGEPTQGREGSGSTFPGFQKVEQEGIDLFRLFLLG